MKRSRADSVSTPVPSPKAKRMRIPTGISNMDIKFVVLSNTYDPVKFENICASISNADLIKYVNSVTKQTVLGLALAHEARTARSLLSALATTSAKDVRKKAKSDAVAWWGVASKLAARGVPFGPSMWETTTI